jgi:capsular polysaccharide biosynthesis protein
MTPYEVRRVFWRRKSFISVVAVVVFVVIGVVLLFARGTPTYTATSTVQFDQPNLMGNAGGSTVPGKLGSLLPTFCRRLDADGAVTSIAGQVNVSADTVRHSISCAPIQSTLLVTVKAKTGNATKSQQISENAANYLATDISSRYGSTLVPPREAIVGEVQQRALLPQKDPQHTRKELALAAFAAALASLALAIAGEPFRRAPAAEEPPPTRVTAPI